MQRALCIAAEYAWPHLTLRGNRAHPVSRQLHRGIRSDTAAIPTAWRHLGAGTVVCFDFDSTIVSGEGLDLLAAFAGVPVARIAAITNDAMDGTVPFERALEQRLALIRPSRELLE